MTRDKSGLQVYMCTVWKCLHMTKLGRIIVWGGWKGWEVLVNPVSIPLPSPETELAIPWQEASSGSWWKSRRFANNHYVVHSQAQPQTRSCARWERNLAIFNSAEPMYACDPEQTLIDSGAALRHSKTPLSALCLCVWGNTPPFSNLSAGAQGRGSLLHNHLSREIINQPTMLRPASVLVTQVICLAESLFDPLGQWWSIKGRDAWGAWK